MLAWDAGGGAGGDAGGSLFGSYGSVNRSRRHEDDDEEEEDEDEEEDDEEDEDDEEGTFISCEGATTAEFTWPFPPCPPSSSE